jgi:hypothetical protein
VVSLAGVCHRGLIQTRKNRTYVLSHVTSFGILEARIGGGDSPPGGVFTTTSVSRETVPMRETRLCLPFSNII